MKKRMDATIVAALLMVSIPDMLPEEPPLAVEISCTSLAECDKMEA